jgi:putative endonuclease
VLNFLWKGFDILRHAARTRRWHPFHALGRRGEDLAHRLLRRKGYTVVARNYRTNTGSGEVDIIAWNADTLVFVEVKSRRTDEFGAPEAAIDLDKRTRLVRAAANYALRANVAWDKVRFDVITVVSGNPPEVTLIRDAFRPHTSMS